MIKEALYKGGFYIVVCPEKEFIDFFNNKYKEDNELGGALGQFYRPDKEHLLIDNKIHNYIWLKEFDKTKEDNLDSLFHEVEHYVLNELNRRQIRVHYEDDEVWDEPAAYFAGHILAKVYKIINQI